MNGTRMNAKQTPGIINRILLALYCAFVITAEFVIRDFFPYRYLLILTPVLFAVFFLISPYVLALVSKINIDSCNGENKKAGDPVWIRIALYILPLAVLLIYYYAYYPGVFTFDSVRQYEQAVQGQYNDWHPVMHTLFAFKLPLAVSGGWTGSIVLFQICCFSAVSGYAFNTVYKYAGPGFTVAVMAFLLLNPVTGHNSVFPWKDMSFAIGTLLLTAYALRIYFSKGGWMRSPENTAAFILATVLTTLFRHNAILFTGPLVIAAVLFLTKKRGAVICLSILILCLGVKVPVYSALGVKKAGSRKAESLGLPMTVIGAAVTYTPGSVDEETLRFAYKVAPKEVWEEKYVTGSYQQVKSDKRTNNEVIEEYGIRKVVSMMSGCFRRSPGVSLKALIKLTEASYILADEYNGAMKTSYEYPDTGNPRVQYVLREYYNFTASCFPYLFMRLGVMHLLLIVSVLAKCRLNKRTDLKKILFILPVFIYNFGTGFFLTCNEDAARFFFYTFMLTPLLLLFILARDDRTSHAGGSLSPID